MKILVINCGSSSLKFQLIDSETEELTAKGLCERIGIAGSRISYTLTGHEKRKWDAPMADHKDAVRLMLQTLTNPEDGAVKNCPRSVQSDTVLYTAASIFQKQP